MEELLKGPFFLLHLEMLEILMPKFFLRILFQIHFLCPVIFISMISSFRTKKNLASYSENAQVIKEQKRNILVNEKKGLHNLPKCFMISWAGHVWQISCYRLDLPHEFITSLTTILLIKRNMISGICLFE